MEEVKKPWFRFYGCVPETLDYPDCTMAEAVENVAKKYPDYIAYDFMGKKTTYANAVKDIIAAAKALKALGVKEEDRVTICMPNTPQTVSMFYAANMVGAIANMIHPLSSENEIAFYLNDSDSKVAITLDQFYPKFEAIKAKTESSLRQAKPKILKSQAFLPAVPTSGDTFLATFCQTRAVSSTWEHGGNQT